MTPEHELRLRLAESRVEHKRRPESACDHFSCEDVQLLLRRINVLSLQIAAEHYRSNGTEVVVNSPKVSLPEPERSLYQCKHPLCRHLFPGASDTHQSDVHEMHP